MSAARRSVRRAARTIFDTGALLFTPAVPALADDPPPNHSTALMPQRALILADAI